MRRTIGGLLGCVPEMCFEHGEILYPQSVSRGRRLHEEDRQLAKV